MKLNRCTISFLVIFLILITKPLFPQNIKLDLGVVKGHIVDVNSKRPLAHALIYVRGTQINAESDSLGYFQLNIPIGEYHIQVMLMGYKSLVYNNLVVMAGRQQELFIDLDPSFTLNEVVVSGRKTDEINNISRLTLNLNNYADIVGSAHDPVRMVTTMPGVGNSSDFTNDLIVRGNSSGGVLWRIEGMEVFNPNHYTNSGNSGGVISVLNASTMGQSYFYTGAFPAEFGNAYSAVYDAYLRDGNMERVEGAVEVNNLDCSISLEMPIIRKKASILVAYRQSVVGAFNAINKEYREMLGAIPDFKDLTFKLSYKTNKSKTNVWGVMGTSEVSVAPYSGFNYSSDFLENTSKSFSGGINNQLFLGGRFTLSSHAGISSINTSNGTRSGVRFAQFVFHDKERSLQTGFKLDWGLDGRNRISVGSKIRTIHSDFEQVREGHAIPGFDIKESYSSINSFLEWKHQFNPHLSMQLGIHNFIFRLNNRSRIEPRWSINYSKGQHSIGWAMGLHSKQNPIGLYFTRVLSHDTINGTYRAIFPFKNLDFIKSKQFVLSYTTSILQPLTYKSELYYQHHYDVPLNHNQSALNLSYIFNDVYEEYALWTNTGKGQSYGWENAFGLDLNGYTLSASASLSSARYNNYDNEWLPTYYDSRYSLKFQAGKKIRLRSDRHYFRIDVAGNWQGGRRYTPIDCLEFYTSGYPSEDRENILGAQYRDYFRMDCKLTYHINTKNVTHVFGIDIRNLTNYPNIYEKYQRLIDYKATIFEQNQIGIFPLLSYKILFGIDK